MATIKLIVPLIALVGVGLATALVFRPKDGDEQLGPAVVIGADTLEIEGVQRKLASIVVPLPDQQCVDRNGQVWSCGQDAIRALRKLVGGTTILCRPHPGAEGLSDCFVDEKSLSELMVRQGWALTCRAGGAGHSDEERNARFLALGLWRGGFEPAAALEKCRG
ncbi:thermonuclease family protein [Nitrospirillum viridazoti]|uniref:Endonuclease YncB(Thermonuclease family) n=1 Tax=Nitrospirillum amazonense TaxID=28077 RepID=A0A560HM08_9PROT|nr:thermonuclease family protein [Nitrospirillum amazonense]TWB46971.1 endonuclease YncB(thermonuclease family) [Nitrospirillum amazonense]